MGGQARRCVRSVDSWVGEIALGGKRVERVLFIYLFMIQDTDLFFLFPGGRAFI